MGNMQPGVGRRQGVGRAEASGGRVPGGRGGRVADRTRSRQGIRDGMSPAPGVIRPPGRDAD